MSGELGGGQLTGSRLVLIEFNELSPSLLDEFMGSGLLPNFLRFYERSQVFTTDAGEDPPRLEPWIQWPTVHAGVPFSEHGIFTMGEGQHYPGQMLGELLSDAGIAVGLFAPMNTNYSRRDLVGYVIPDPWDARGQASPPFLRPFSQAIANQVQSSSTDSGITVEAALRLGWFVARHGLSRSTVLAAARQMSNDRRDEGQRWGRASVLDSLEYDVFRNLNHRFHVQFASFFSNSTAHLQHYYWRNMRPELFVAPPPRSDHPSLEGAIRAGYQAMDRLLGRFLNDYGNDLLILCTALSQRPWTDTSKRAYRPRDFRAFVAFLNIPPDSVVVRPVMAEEFHIECEDAIAAAEVERMLAAVTVAGEPIMDCDRDGSDVLARCRGGTARPAESLVRNESSGASSRFGDLFHPVHTSRSGRHDRAGALWIRSGVHRVVDDDVPLTAIAPTILAHFGVPQPPSMPGRPLPISSTAVRSTARS